MLRGEEMDSERVILERPKVEHLEDEAELREHDTRFSWTTWHVCEGRHDERLAFAGTPC